jgi:hypothetical protein
MRCTGVIVVNITTVGVTVIPNSPNICRELEDK